MPGVVQPVRLPSSVFRYSCCSHCRQAGRTPSDEVSAFAIGLYLPIYLNAAIMIGGVVRMFVDGRKNVDAKTKEAQATDGTLYCAGMIAGEGLVGILLAILAVVNVSSVFDLSESINLGNRCV